MVVYHYLVNEFGNVAALKFGNWYAISKTIHFRQPFTNL
jgi:hypothetical protein